MVRYANSSDPWMDIHNGFSFWNLREKEVKEMKIIGKDIVTSKERLKNFIFRKPNMFQVFLKRMFVLKHIRRVK